MTPRRVLFFCHSLAYIRFADPVLRSLLDRGHHVHLLIERADHDSQERRWLDEIGQHPNFGCARTDALRNDSWRPIAGKLRRAADYVRFLTPAFSAAPYLVARAERRAPPLLVWLLRHRRARSDRVLGTLTASTRALESALPRNAQLVRELRERRPDVVVLWPHLMPGNRHSEVVRAAQKLGVRTCMAVPSWDNLSSKQFIHELPDLLLVWNETQRREAVEIHRVPPERIEITGAQNFDVWFDWSAGDRADFCRRVGLDPERPFFTYLGGSLFPGELTEAQFARRWVDALRGSSDPRIRRAGVLLRPHPKRAEQWREERFEDVENVVVWPPGPGEMPVSASARADFFDSIHHSAGVVALNTSAMIESAILGRPVFTLLVPEFASSQEGVFHFDYLLEVGGGLPHVARSIDENLEQLARLLHEGEAGESLVRRRRFLAEFVRPHGLDRPATPYFVDAIERTAALGPSSSRRLPGHTLPLTALLGLGRASLPVTLRLVRLARSRRSPLRRVGARLRKLPSRSRRLLRSLTPAPGTPLALPPAREARPEGALRVLFSALTPTTLKNFETVVRSLAQRGHQVDLVIHEPDQPGAPVGLLDSLAAEPGVRIVEARGGDAEFRVRFAVALRALLDYLQFSDERFHDTYRARAERRLPKLARPFMRGALTRRRRARAAVRAILAAVERYQRPSPAILDFMRRLDPDVALFSPYIGLRTLQPDFLRAARFDGVPTAVCVASWDNLTSKSLMRPVPGRVLVWNETQRREAAELHGVPPATVVITGAQCFDEWLTWTPRPRDVFCRRVGLDPARPFVLYTCFTPFKGAPRELDFVERWLARLRTSSDPLLREVGVLVRPHPKRAGHWREADLSRFAHAVVWPRDARWPTDTEAKADYFDSIHHSAAVVGINTTAMLEAGAIGRPVLTIFADEYWESQQGTLHFRYLTKEGCGLLRGATSLEEHEAQLGAAIRDGGDARAGEAEAFVEAFLRPHGLEVPATPIFVDAVERLAGASRSQLQVRNGRRGIR